MNFMLETIFHNNGYMAIAHPNCPSLDLLYLPIVIDIRDLKLGGEKMKKYDLVAPCGDYCGGCGQYNGLIVETAKQMQEYRNLSHLLLFFLPTLGLYMCLIG
jgi:hypothetical protein